MAVFRGSQPKRCTIATQASLVLRKAGSRIGGIGAYERCGRVFSKGLGHLPATRRDRPEQYLGWREPRVVHRTAESREAKKVVRQKAPTPGPRGRE